MLFEHKFIKIMNINLLSKRLGGKFSSCLDHKLSKKSQTKKIGKIISKDKRPKRVVDDWSNFSKNTYARLLLQFSMNDLSFGYSFLEVLSDAIKRTQKQIYTYHCKMLNEHGNIKQIIVDILGYKLQRKRQELPISKPHDQLIQKTNISLNFNQVQINFNTERSLDSEEIRYLSNLMMSDSQPEDCDYDYDLNEAQMLDDQQLQKQQSQTADNQQSSIQSEEDIQVPIQTENGILFSSSMQ